MRRKHLKTAKKAMCVGMTTLMVFTGMPLEMFQCTGAEGVHAEEYTVEDTTYKYEVLKDGTVSITGYSGSDTDITIPSDIDGKKVTSIGTYAFSGCSSLEKIKLPEELTSIGYAAFSGCSSLSEIDLPEGITNIGDYTFEGCSSLTEIICPKGVTSIKDGTFNGCSTLTEISLPEGVISIGYLAFSSCTNLKSIKLPSTINSIEFGSIGYEQYWTGEGYNLSEHYHKLENFVIYGYSGTEAENYADERGFTFINLQNAIDEETDITIEYGSNAIDKTINLQVNELNEEDNGYKALKLEEKLADANTSINEAEFKVYDIKLLDEKNNEVQPNTKVWVKLPCPEEYNSENCSIYHIDAEGIVTDMNATYDGEHFIFEIDHFSIYLITEAELKTKAEYVSGDANRDGKIDTQDAVLLKKHLAGYTELNINIDACDVNGDGDINSADAVILLKHLAGYDVGLAS